MLVETRAVSKYASIQSGKIQPGPPHQPRVGIHHTEILQPWGPNAIYWPAPLSATSFLPASGCCRGRVHSQNVWTWASTFHSARAGLSLTHSAGQHLTLRQRGGYLKQLPEHLLRALVAKILCKQRSDMGLLLSSVHLSNEWIIPFSTLFIHSPRYQLDIGS